MKKLLFRLILLLAILQITYLAVANLALNLPLTQSLINQLRPEKYGVRWEQAWTWYPLSVHARGVSVDGQTSSQQWQADVSAVSASLAILPLLSKTVHLYGVDARNLGFRLRPRPKQGKDYGEISSFFPPIRGRDPESPATKRPEPKSGKGWKVVVDDVEAEGSHEFWVFQVRGAMEGALRANVSFESRGGPLSVDGGELDVRLSSLEVNEDTLVSVGGDLKGRFELAPFVPSENPGLKVLGFLSADADLDALVGNLEFLDFYLRELNGLEVDGKGRLKGHLNYDKGSLTSGTDLSISADELLLSAAPYEVRGAGGIEIGVEAPEPETLRIGILFGTLEALHAQDQAPLFTGEGLAVEAGGSAKLLPIGEREKGKGRLAVTIPSVAVRDLSAYQRYLPEKWGILLHGGQGTLSGRAEYSAQSVRGELSLASSDADLGVKDFRFRTNLDLGLKVSGGVAQAAAVDLSGSYLRLDGARLASAKKGESEPWIASLTIGKGTLGVPVPEGEDRDSGFRRLSDVFKKKGFKAMAASADADLDARLEVSDLGWVNLLFTNPFDLAISGSGEIAAGLRVRDGWLAKGTALRIQPQGLAVQVLDYLAQGEGLVALEFLEGGEQPDMRLDASLADAGLKRRGEEEAYVQDVTLEVSAVANNITLDSGGEVTALDLRIPSARVKDMSVYNQYLPENLPVQLLGGEADLAADVRLEPNSAGGFLMLKTDGLRSRVDEQEVSGRLTLDIKLQGGVPSEMDFDISGSSLLLDEFKVSGEQKSFDAVGWQARFDLTKARAVWRKPVRLDLKAEVEMVDSRPIVAMFANQRGKEGWLDSILTVRNIKGEASMEVDGDRALIPYAMVGSNKIDIGAKGLVDPGGREAIFYARFSKLDGILKLRDGERNFDILGAKETFDAYAPGELPLALKGSQRSTESEPAPRTTEQEAPVAEPRENGVPAKSEGAFGNFSGE